MGEFSTLAIVILILRESRIFTARVESVTHESEKMNGDESGSDIVRVDFVARL